MMRAAEDEAERERYRAELYDPPPEARQTPRRGDAGPVRRQAGVAGRPGGGMSMAQAQALTARLAAEDSQLGGGASR